MNLQYNRLVEMVVEIDEIVNLCDYEQIYLIRGPKNYVGRHALTTVSGWYRTIEDRFEEHLQAAKQPGDAEKCRVLCDAIRANGAVSFSIEPIEICTKDKAKVREIFWISEKNTVHPHGYNLMSGNASGNYVMHPESREKCSEALRSFGKSGTRSPTAKLRLIRAPNHTGYRGYHNGEPHGFFSNNFTLDEKRAMALKWHLHGILDHERRLPRERKNTNEQGESINMPGVKVRYNTAGHEVYHAYHPTRPDVKEKSFATQNDAEEYAKLLQSFGNVIPEKYKVTPRGAPIVDGDCRFIRQKKSKSALNKVIGFELSLPASLTNTGKAISRYFGLTAYSTPIACVQAAREVRDTLLKEPLPDFKEPISEDRSD